MIDPTWLIPAREAPPQVLRLQRFLLGAFSYLIATALLWMAWGLGFVPSGPVLAGTLGIVVTNVTFYAMLRSGINLRFADPSLTTQQSIVAIVLLMAITYHFNEGRELALIVSFVIFQFGVFRLTTRDFVRVALYMLMGYALVINLIMHLRPGAIRNVYAEWFSWLVFAAVLPWFGLIGGRISNLRRKLSGRNAELTQALETIEHLATRDPLTGRHNRAFFVDSLSLAISRSARRRHSLALLQIDIDRLKSLNDGAGQQTGDEALRAVANRLDACIGRSDLIARVGGDEFAVLLEDCGTRADLAEIATKMLAAVQRPFSPGSQAWPLSIGIGIATYPDDGDSHEALLASAATALANAKSEGRGTFRFYASGMGDARERVALERELRSAIERGELRLYYQPKVVIASGRVHGVEALVRWQHPKRGLLGPGEFIALAEESGLIVPIGRWVLETACNQAAQWRSARGLELRIAVNLAAPQFRSDGLVADIAAILQRASLPPAALEIEVTESIVMHDPEQAVSVMRELRNLGVTLAMDDFGTGYSSLGNLKRFPFDVVKIDRAFVRDLPSSADDVSIARAVIAMAHSLRLSVTAEGVERAEQLEFLRAEGCEEYQGFYCSRPVPESQLLALLGNAAVRS